MIHLQRYLGKRSKKTYKIKLQKLHILVIST